MASNAYAIKQLLSKMRNPDADFRFMALTDLVREITSRANFSSSDRGLGLDEPTEKETVDIVLELINDKNTEVKNQAVKTLGVLVRSVGDPRMISIVDKLATYGKSDDEQLRDLSGLALKTVVSEIPSGSKLAPTLCTRLIPRLVSQLQDSNSTPDILSANLDILSDLLIRFDSYYRAVPAVQLQCIKALEPLIANPRPAVTKRSVIALESLAGCCTDVNFETLITKVVLPRLKQDEDIGKLKIATLLVGVLAKTSAARLSQTISNIVPLIISAQNKKDDELTETCLQTLESLLLRLPTQMTSFIPAVIDLATQAIKHDPNYAAEDTDDMDVDDEGVDGEEEDDDEEFGDEYSDDDDVSWKVRRGATKLLSTLIVTRFELLQEFYKSISPVLISRFNEREESVKLEVWATYTQLLKQTKLHIGSEHDVTPAERILKRKRANPSEVVTANGPLSSLRSQAPAITKSIVKCLSCKSIPVRQAGFVLLSELIHVLGGGLETQVIPLMLRVEASLKTSDGGISGLGTNLKIEVFTFLSLFFTTHHPRSFMPELPRLVNHLILGINDKYHRIASEAFVAAASLVKILKPLAPTSPLSFNSSAALKAIYEATLPRLTSSSADQDVKDRAAICLQTLISHAADQFENDFQNSLPILTQRLENEITRTSALKSPVPKGESFDQWIQDILPLTAAFLRKNNRALKISCFECLNALLQRIPGKLRLDTIHSLVSDLHPLINNSDPHLLPLAFKSLGLIFPLATDLTSTDRDAIMAPVYLIMKSSAISQTSALEGLISLFTSIIQSRLDNASNLLDALISTIDTSIPLSQAKSSTNINLDNGTRRGSNNATGLQSYQTVSRCIGAVIRTDPTVGVSAVTRFSNSLQNDPNDDNVLSYFSLLCLGELGRVVDLSAQPEVFESALARFSSSSEDIRNAAAFAIGNIAAGSSNNFLPAIFKLMQGDKKQRYIVLQALKEFITHVPSHSLAHHADTLWDPLFDDIDVGVEMCRNVAAECLGKLTLSDPLKYLPRLQERLKSTSSHIRMTCVTSIRFTLTDDTPGFDEHLGPFLTDFLLHIRDTDLSVRALALSVLDSATHNKPELIKEILAELLPLLYAETIVDQSLVRFVEMGPFKHRVDDGLETRKLAYSTMLTLLDMCLSKIDINEFTDRVLNGISDEDEIKVLCYLMLIRLSHIAPATVAPRLDQSTEAFSATINLKLKDNAVKQDHERTAELQRSALRAVVALLPLASPAVSPKFCQLIRETNHHATLGMEFKDLINKQNLSSLGYVTNNGRAS
ncbi:armadillo-type protein [Melampsora americana]|nr:armadillo-type protein [Melampsora americana]